MRQKFTKGGRLLNNILNEAYDKWLNILLESNRGNQSWIKYTQEFNTGLGLPFKYKKKNMYYLLNNVGTTGQSSGEKK